MAEIAGLKDGYCYGRGGSMHLQWIDAGAMGTNAIVGGAVPFAAGFAFADKWAETDNVSVTYFGDGATNIGSVLETMNLAAAWKLPVCFFIENNQYAVSTTVQEATGETAAVRARAGLRHPQLAGRRHGRRGGLPRHAAGLRAHAQRRRSRRSSKPTPTATSTRTARSPAAPSATAARIEESEWRDARPDREDRGASCVRRGLYTEDELAGVRKSIKAAMGEIGAGLVEPDPAGKPGQQRIRTELWPDPAFLDVGIRGDLSSLEGLTVREEADFDADELEQRKFVDVVADVMGHRMDEDQPIVVMGEDVHRLNGGSRGATKGLKEKFDDRVLGTPISECAFTGLGGGLALDGRFYPVVELMYADFIWVAADQIFNQIGKARHMFGGGHDMPLLLRIKIGIGHRLRLAALDGPGRRPGHLGRLADHRPVHAAGLRRPGQRRHEAEGPGRRARARRRPLQDLGCRRRSTTSTTSCRPARPPSGGPGRTSR